MAKLSWQIETSQGTVTFDGPTISDANMARFLDWVWQDYPLTETDEDGVTTPLPRTPANEATAFRMWAARNWSDVKRTVLAWEQAAAAKTASDAVTDIES